MSLKSYPCVFCRAFNDPDPERCRRCKRYLSDIYLNGNDVVRKLAADYIHDYVSTSASVANVTQSLESIGVKREDFVDLMENRAAQLRSAARNMGIRMVFSGCTLFLCSIVLLFASFAGPIVILWYGAMATAAGLVSRGLVKLTEPYSLD